MDDPTQGETNPAHLSATITLVHFGAAPVPNRPTILAFISAAKDITLGASAAVTAACGGLILKSSPDHALAIRRRLSFSGDDNQLNEKIATAVRDIENLLKPHLSGSRR